MLSSEADIEKPSSCCHGESNTVPVHSSGTVNPNLTEPTKDQIDAFFSSISLVACLLYNHIQINLCLLSVRK